MKHSLIAACLLATGATTATGADFSDTALAYRYGTGFTEPARPEDITKNILTLTHVNAGRSGLHFLSLEGRYSDSKDPARNSSAGANEHLLTYRWQLATAQVRETPLAFGPVRDLAVTLGTDFTSKNTLFAPRKRALVAGPVLKFDVPGFLDLGLLWYKERNHKGIPGTPHPDLTFDGTWLLNATWAIPFQAGSVPATFQGLYNRLGAKGNDFNNKPTAGETLLRAAVMFDVGQSMGLGKRRWLAGIGYEYWKNKYGTPAGVGTFTKTPTVHFETHF